MAEPIIFHSGTLEEINGGLVQVGCKCMQCGKISFPQTERCMFCGAEDYQKVPLSEVGTVFSYSITRLPVGPYKPPTIGAFIDLPEGTRVYGQIHAEETEVKVGMKVKAQTGILWSEKDGKEVLGYYYVMAGVKDGGTK